MYRCTKMVYLLSLQLRYLELLKLRFGESHLQFCEVMLKDVADSRRINTNIHSKIETSEQKVLTRLLPFHHHKPLFSWINTVLEYTVGIPLQI